MPVVKTIAQNFVAERCSNEVISVGINAIREIIQRLPSILREPGMDDFVQDLALYSKKTQKCVSIAARSLLNLIRLENFAYILTNHV
jgi:protein SDA1